VNAPDIPYRPLLSNAARPSTFAVSAVDEQENGERIVLGATVEREGQLERVCVADLVLLVQSPKGAAP